MPTITDDQADRLGQIADSLDACLYPLQLKLADSIKIEGMAGSMREARDKLVELVKEITGEDPWETNPLVG